MKNNQTLELPSHLEDVQHLLHLVFLAEKKYYESAEDIQEVTVRRYLYHQSSQRNTYCHALIELLVLYDQDPDVLFVSKGKLNRNDLDMKRVWELDFTIPFLKECLDYDEKITAFCQKILDKSSSYIASLEIISHIYSEILFGNFEGLELLRQISSGTLSPQKESKVIRFPISKCL